MNEMRIYVASLSDYNNGRLEGKWLDLADYSDASELMEAIQEMLDDLTKKYNDGEVREEWAVHDYEGIPSTLASEYMSEQDFQQLYDIAEVADDRGIPVEVLIERAGDTGSDDYQALADSLMFVVDGYDESDIVYEYESQLGTLGNDFWSNHIYIDDVTERVIYGEDVDRFREDILYENPDMDEAEAERQAEEMADEEAERREDLTTYLEDMGYSGDEIPSFVSKDYEGAWKRSLSYDFDVINHDGQMYVFSSNYSLGGTILSGMIGAYIGYKVGRAKPQKKGFETEKKIGRKVKGAFTKKKMARGGGVSYNKNWEVVGITSNGKMFKERITLGRMSDKEDVKNALNRRTDLNIREITSIKEVFAKGGSTYQGGGEIKTSQLELHKWYTIDGKELRYFGERGGQYAFQTKHYQEVLFTKPKLDKATIKGISTYQGGGEIKNYFKKNLEIVKSDKPDSFGEDYYVIRDKKDKAHYVEGGYWYIVQNLKERGFTSNKEVSDMIKNAKEVSGIKTFAKGGEVDGKKYFTIYRDEEGSVKTEFDNYSDALADYNEFASDDANIALYEVINGENDLLKENQSSAGIEYVELSNGDIVVTLEKIDGKWEEGEVLDGETPYGWGGKRYMGYLKPKDIAQWLSKDYGGYFEIVDQYAKGGGIGFKALSNKVAKRYEGKAVAPKYQGEYGKRYSKSEAKEVGDKVAGKVYWNQQGRKMAEGGGVDYYRYDVLVHFLTNNGENMEKEYMIPMALSEKDAENRAIEKFHREDFDRYDAEQIQYISVHKREKSFAKGGGVDGKILKEISTHKAVKKGDKIYIYEKGLEIQNDDDKTSAKQYPHWYKDELIMTIPSENEEDLYDIFESFEENNRINRQGYAQGGGISGLNDLIRG